MSWITLNTAKARIAPAEIATVSRLGNDVASLEAIGLQVIEEVRGYCGNLGAAGTIPSECENDALALTVWYYISQVPDKQGTLATDARKESKEDALKHLVLIARGVVKVVPPETPAAVQPAHPTPRITARRRHYAGSDEEGA